MGTKLAVVVGWFGTFLGALALLLALSTAPATWASHHHALYLLLVVSLVICLMIAVVGPLALAIFAGRFWWVVWCASKRPHFAIHGTPVMVDITAVPHGPTAQRGFQFVTNRLPRRFIRTPAPPVGLRITRPIEASVWASQLPQRV
ncbi:MAG: hypothetical protein ACRDNF_04740 [Streptosporangiaceae bacterium]